MLDTLMAMNPWTVASFVGAGVVLNLTPGADVLFTTACGIKGGWRQGVAAALGVSLGSLVHVVLAVAGLSALIAALPNGLTIIRFAGAAYLLYLAVQAWRSQPHGPEAQQTGGGLIAALRKGALTNILNPKVSLFILAFLPQFTDPAIGPVWEQMLILGFLFTTTGFFITSLYGVAAGLAGAALQRRMTILNKISAVIFGGLAARLVLD